MSVCIETCVGTAAPGCLTGHSPAAFEAEGGSFYLTGARKEGSNGDRVVPQSEFLRVRCGLPLRTSRSKALAPGAFKDFNRKVREEKAAKYAKKFKFKHYRGHS